MDSTNTSGAATANSSTSSNSNNRFSSPHSTTTNDHHHQAGSTRTRTAAFLHSTGVDLIMEQLRGGDDSNNLKQKRQKISNNNNNNNNPTTTTTESTLVGTSITGGISNDISSTDVTILLSGSSSEQLLRRKSSSNSSSSRRNSERYAGWPEELRQAHSLLRRMIRPVVGYRTPTDAEIEAAPNQLVLDLCRKHPALAKEKFLCHNKQVELSPLKFLIHNKANVDVISGFCRSFPQAVQQVDGKNDFFNYLDGYPLHLACTIRPNDGELIAVLAKAYPPAVSTPNEGGFLPLHLLLEYRGFTPALRGLQALIEIDPETSIRKPPSPTNNNNNNAAASAANAPPPPVFSILSSNQLTLQHMECIYSRLPRHVIRLDFPTNCFRGNCLSLDHARTIGRVLHQIQELNLQPPSWTTDAWMFFVQSCQQHAVNLRKLALRPPAQLLLSSSSTRQQQQPQHQGGVPTPTTPSTAAASANDVRTALIHFLYGCTALEMLDLQTPTNAAAAVVAAGPGGGGGVARLVMAGGGGRGAGAGGAVAPDLTAPIVHLLTNGRLVSLRVMGYNLSSRPIFAALINNTQLKHLVVQLQQPPQAPPPPPPPDDNNNNGATTTTATTLTLSSVLENHNVTLQQAQTSYPMNFPTYHVEAAKIRYYTRLNRMGRAAFRDSHQHQHGSTTTSSTLTQMLQILIGAQLDPEIRTSHPRECIATLYGLLRESPGLWSRNFTTTTATNPRAGIGGAGVNNTTAAAVATPRKRKQSNMVA